MTIYDIENFLSDILQPSSFQDFCYNGIQIEGNLTPKRLAVGVSLNLAFLQEAVKRGADIVLVHHGFFGKEFLQLKGLLRQRIAYSLAHNITVMGYHLPLDAHPQYGNNALIAKHLELTLIRRVDVGYIATYESPLPWDAFEKRLRKVFPHSRLHIYQHTPCVQKVGIIAGGSASSFRTFERETDTFICGETKEQTLHESQEMNINFVNAGHYYTEVFGVKALGELLHKEFRLPWEFIDIPNEV